MKNIVATLLQDTQTTCRVTRILLRHTAPKNRQDALKILQSRIGVYGSQTDKTALGINQEIDQYFEAG